MWYYTCQVTVQSHCFLTLRFGKKLLIRGEPPSNPIMPFEMNDYLKKFAEKVEALINDVDTLKEDELKQLGQKEQDEEVKKFIEVNTQQLAPEKYLCPLSGKKFKGPEFVKKHIITKHGERVEAVKKGKSYKLKLKLIIYFRG